MLCTSMNAQRMGSHFIMSPGKIQRAGQTFSQSSIRWFLFFFENYKTTGFKWRLKVTPHAFTASSHLHAIHVIPDSPKGNYITLSSLYPDLPCSCQHCKSDGTFLFSNWQLPAVKPFLIIHYQEDDIDSHFIFAWCVFGFSKFNFPSLMKILTL